MIFTQHRDDRPQNSEFVHTGLKKGVKALDVKFQTGLCER
jgi:hypothetical protein